MPIEDQGARRDAATTVEAPFHRRLRAATARDHERVDAAFARFDLADRDSYAAFLAAHARVLPAAERAIDPGALLSEGVPGWRGRSEAIEADLAALGEAAPSSRGFALPPGGAARWGALYVIEGSRLGGVMLARRVAEGLPRAYLSAAHGPGDWRATLAALDRAAEAGGEDFGAAAIAGAHATFAAYARAAGGGDG